MSTKKFRPAKKALEELGVGPVTFASLLRTYRLCEELTLSEMASKLKISISHLSDIENERKFVSIERAKLFAKLLKDNEKYFVLVSLRDQLRKADCDYDIELKAIS